MEDSFQVVFVQLYSYWECNFPLILNSRLVGLHSFLKGIISDPLFVQHVEENRNIANKKIKSFIYT